MALCSIFIDTYACIENKWTEFTGEFEMLPCSLYEKIPIVISLPQGMPKFYRS